MSDNTNRLLEQAITLGGWNLYGAYFIVTATQLDIADHMSDGENDVEALAKKSNTHAPSLRRLLRALATLGFTRQHSSHSFSLTALGKLLRKNDANSVHSCLNTLSGDIAHQAFGKLKESLRTGATSFDLAFGKNIFEFLAENPHKATQFSETMAQLNSAEPPAVAKAYDFSKFKTVIDVGGATGNMLITILKQHPNCSGILSDLEHVVAEAPTVLAQHSMTQRIRCEAHNFFESIPCGGDGYVLSHIIHDWDEEQCLRILNNCFTAMPDDAMLLIVEMVLPEDGTPHVGALMDMAMLMHTGGIERTPSEYEALLNKAGFKMTAVIPTDSDVSIVEAKKL